MFIKNSKEEINNKTIVGESVFINGNFDCLEDVVIFGKVEGFIKTTKNVYVKNSSVIDADIKANNAFIEGIVNGNIDCSGAVEISSCAKVKGNISTFIINIEKGALFNGKCSIKEDKNIIKDKDSAKNIETENVVLKENELVIEEVKQSRKKKKTN